MKYVARGFLRSIHKCEMWRRGPLPSLKALIILPVSFLFCLIVLGCDVPENASVGIGGKPQKNSSLAVSTQDKLRASSRQVLSPNKELPRIVAFGDSLTAGLGVDPDEAYPSQLARWLRERGFTYEVINAGVSGDTSAGGLRRVGWILKNQPRLVIVELGANDGLRGQPLQETYKNLYAIIETLKAKGVVVVLAGMRIPLNYGDEYTQEFTDLFVRLAQEQDVPLIPFFLEGVATHRELNQGDGLHPNAKGYSVVVQNVGRVLQPILKELAEKG